MNDIKKAWWKEAVVYQIYPRSFQDSNGDGIGDLKGIERRLGYLKKLGADVLWLCPVYDSPNDDNGYDIRDYQKIMEEAGTMKAFDELLAAAHSMGMKIIMDLVVNHSSDEHRWFQESRKSKNNPYRNYYIWREAKEGSYPNTWRSNFGGSAWEYDEETGEYYLHLFSRKQPDLNWDYEPLRQEIYGMMRWWLDKGIDGFRMDVISYISKDPAALTDRNQPEKTTAANGPHVHEYLREMYREVLSGYDVMTVGETPDVTVMQARKYVGFDSKELQMVFQFQLMDVDGGESDRWGIPSFCLNDIRKVMDRWQTGLDGKAWNSLFWNNHDQPRVVSRFGDDSTEFYRKKSAKMLGVCLQMMQGTPYIYQGEELGMTNVTFDKIEDYRDIDTINAYKEYTGAGTAPEIMLKRIRYRSRDNARTPMQWDDSPNAGFTNGTPWIGVNPAYTYINAKEALADPDSIFYFYQALIRLRKQYEIIVYGSYEPLDQENPSVYSYKRRLGKEELWVFCNFTREEQKIPVARLQQQSQLLLANYEKPYSESLRAYEARIYRIAHGSITHPCKTKNKKCLT